MNQSNSLQASVRRELALEASASHRPRRSSLLGISAVALLLLSLGGSPLSAQASYQQELLPGFSSLLVSYSSNPVIKDLDGDGDLDAVVGETDGCLRYFKNIGNSSTPIFVERSGSANPLGGIDVGNWSSPELADLDGDGDLDAVIGELVGGLRYFVNTGTSSTPAFAEGTGSANPFSGIDVSFDSDPGLADLDGDGDLDAIIGERNGGLRYFENTGTSSVPAFAELTGSANPLDGAGMDGSPDLADLDGDGDFDAIVGGINGGLRYFENTGTSSAPAFAEATGSGNPFDGVDVGSDSTPVLGDLDGDGDLDLVTGERDGSLRYFENTGTSGAPAFAEGAGSGDPLSGIDVGRQSDPDLVDLDGDGDLDAVLGEYDGSLRYFANTGTSSVPAFAQATGSLNPFDGVDVGEVSTPDLADLDGDGDLDAVVGEGLGGFRYFANTGTPSAPAFAQVTGSGNPFAGVVISFAPTLELADLDGDGDLDAVFGGRFGSLVYFANTGTSVEPAFSLRTGSANPFSGIGVYGNSSPDLVDVDGDGDLDAVIGDSLGGLRFFPNTGSSSAPSFAESTGSTNPFSGVNIGQDSRPNLVDLDGDGDLDALVGESEGRIAFFRSIHVVFADGFEEGDTSRWSVTVP